MRSKLFPTKLASIVTVSAILTLTACKSDKLPTFPTSTPSPSIPSPSSGGLPSPSSLPTPPSIPSSSPPSSSPPSSSPSGPSSPSSGPSAPSLPSPGLPDLSGKQGSSGGDVAKSGQKSGQSGDKKPGDEKTGGEKKGSQPGSESGEAGSQRESRTAAGDDLQKAGEKIAKAGSGEIDPLIPETDSTDETDGDVFADSSNPSGSESDSEPAGGGQGNESSETSDQVAGSSSGQSNPGQSNSGQSNSGQANPREVGSELPPGLQDDIEAAQEALQKAGEALQEAGAAVANAETDAELQAADEMLGDARIAVIVATQGIEMVEEDLMEMPDFGVGEGDVFSETSEALQEANVALVIATRSILIARTGSAEFPEGNGDATANGEVAALEDELDESLVIFDGQIGDAREAVLTKSTPPSTGGGSGGLPSGEPVPTSEQGELMQLPSEPTEDLPEEQQIATAEMPNLNQGDIPDAQGDDIVAQQLREAAMIESDPELQAKLWEEYKRYKEGL